MAKHARFLLGIFFLLAISRETHAQTPNADFDNSGKVDFADFLAFAQAFGSTQPQYDLNRDGTVDFPDFLLFAQAFGPPKDPDKTITVNLPGGGTMDFVYIPPGTFTMGSNTTDKYRQDETPQHQVKLTHGFYLEKYEVTQAQWEAVIGTRPWEGHEHLKGGELIVKVQEDCPAVDVSWYDAHTFIHRLNVAAGDSLYRLPTEAEWEYAYRAGTTTRYFWGDDESQSDKYSFDGWETNSDIWFVAAPIGSKSPNPWGLYDIAGNVAEWCQDRYNPYTSEPQVDPILTANTNLDRVARGGWIAASRRINAFPGNGEFFIGFRLLRGVSVLGYQNHAISGRVTESTVGLGGVTVTLSGYASATTTTDADGNYTFSDLKPGSYVVTPSKSNYAFSPDSLNIALSGTDATGQDFSGTRTIPSGNGDQTITATLIDSTTMAFVYIPPGTFTMGSPDSDAEAYDDEKPQHEVTISKGFYLGQYEVTQEQWQAVMGANPSNNPGVHKPVEEVSWDDVQEFVHKLNAAAQDSLYRLPSEAEWAYACRARTTTRWSFGNDENKLGDYAWYDGNDSPYGTKEVGTKLPNPWGLYDMYGNVAEWVQDWYGPYTADAQTDPTGASTGSGRSKRGGAFNDGARRVRSAMRGAHGPTGHTESIGFRLLKRVN